MNLHTQHLDIGYQKRRIVEDLNLSIPEGKITALIGANGSGKSTILKTLCRIMEPTAGEVLLDGKDIHKMDSRKLARIISILPQNPEAPEGLTVEELVGYGRAPYSKGFGSLKAEDKEKIRWALEVTNMTEFADRPVDQLSGGQRQRAWIAMCVAQDTETVFLDEPTTFLDIAFQLEIMKMLEKLNREYGKTIIMVVHDLNHASQYADHIVAIKSGKITAQGNPAQVITEENLQNIYGVRADIFTDQRTGKPVCIPFDIM